MKINFILFLLLPFFSFSQTLVGSEIIGKAINDKSGYAVSLSSDGSLVAIGAPFNDDNGSDSGHVRIYENQSAGWTQVGNTIVGKSAGDQSGFSVSLSSDGSIVAIGSIFNDSNGTDSGQVRIFKNQSGTWTQIGGDINGEAVGDQSGYTVSLSSDGSIVAIGAPYNNGNGSDSGHVRVYKNESGIWTLLGNAIFGETATDYSGSSLSLSSDGTVLAIGAIGNDGNGIDSGHVRVYKYQTNTWFKIGSDLDGEVAGNYFGFAVSLSPDGSVVASSSIYHALNGNKSGQVRVYKNQSNTWQRLGNDINGLAAGNQLGLTVSLSTNGDFIAIGSAFNNVSGSSNSSGHVSVYKNESGIWTPLGSNIYGKVALDGTGYAISLTPDGTKIAIGAPNNRTMNTSGNVRIYDFNTVLSTDNFTKSNVSIYPNPVKETLNISLNKNSELKQVSVYTILNQYLFSVKSIQINVNNLKSGIYFIEVETNAGKAIKKFIKQ